MEDIFLNSKKCYMETGDCYIKYLFIPDLFYKEIKSLGYDISVILDYNKIKEIGHCLSSVKDICSLNSFSGMKSKLCSMLDREPLTRLFISLLNNTFDIRGIWYEQNKDDSLLGLHKDKINGGETDKYLTMVAINNLITNVTLHDSNINYDNIECIRYDSDVKKTNGLYSDKYICKTYIFVIPIPVSKRHSNEGIVIDQSENTSTRDSNNTCNYLKIKEFKYNLIKELMKKSSIYLSETDLSSAPSLFYDYLFHNYNNGF